MTGNRAWLLLAAVMVSTAFVFAAACRGGGSTERRTGPTALRTVAPTPAITVLPTAASAAVRTPAPSASPSPFPAATGRLLVYTKRVRKAEARSRGWPTLEVITYDVHAKRRLASFKVGKVGEYPVDVLLARNKIAVNLEQRVVLYDIDGSSPTELHMAPQGGSIIGIGAPRDGTKLALAEEAAAECDPMCPAYADITSVVFLDAVSGKELLVVPQSVAGFADFRGQAAVFTWRDDGRGVVVQGYTYSEAPGGTATVLLDGSVRTHAVRGFEYVAPNGRYAAHGFDLPCRSVSGHNLILRDLDADMDVASSHDYSLVFTPGEWSPDSTEFLYSTYGTRPSPSGALCREWVKETRTWYVLRVDGSPPSPVADPEPLRDQWYGKERPKLFCGDRVVLYPYCPDERGVGQAVDLYFGDTKVDNGIDIQILGFMETPAK